MHIVVLAKPVPDTTGQDELLALVDRLNKDAAVTVVVYKNGGAVTKTFAFKDTKSAAAKAKEIAEAAEAALK